MWSFYTSISIVLIIILILIWNSSSDINSANSAKWNSLVQSGPMANVSTSEHFDTFYNHDMDALQWREDRYGVYAPNSLASEALWDKYTWAQKDKAGDNIYDKVYDNITASQFNNFPVMGDVRYTQDDLLAMYNPNPYIDFRGQRVDLSEKTI